MSDILTQKQEAELDTALGKITVRIPSLPKRLEIERRRTIYAGGLAILSSLGADIAEMFAFLDIIMIKCDVLKRKDADQGAWDYDALSELDFDKLEDAYTKVAEWLNSFRKRVEEK